MELVTTKEEATCFKQQLKEVREALLRAHEKAQRENKKIEAACYLDDAGAVARLIKTLRSA